MGLLFTFLKRKSGWISELFYGKYCTLILAREKMRLNGLILHNSTPGIQQRVVKPKVKYTASLVVSDFVASYTINLPETYA